MEPLERAVTEIRDKNYGSAIRLLEMLTGRDPSNADAFKHLSQAYYQTGEVEKAAEAGQRYAALRPTDATGHHNLGVLLARLGQTEAAERAFRAALSADPGHAKARRALYQLTGEGEAPEGGAPASATAASGAGAAALAAAAEPKRKRMPWQAKLAAVLTVVASAAILLWLFLPGGPANPGDPTQAPEPSPNPVTVPPPTQPTAPNPREAEQPQPSPTPQVQPSPQPETTAPAPTPREQPTQPMPAPQPSQPAPGASSAPKPLFTPEQARRVAESMDAAERQQLQGKLRYLANWLRNDKACKDPDFWPILQAGIATSGPAMVPGGMSIGSGEVMALITNAETNVQAADNIERYSRNLKSALPYNVKQQIAQSLALATSADEAYRSVQQVLKQSNTTLSQEANQVLIQAAQEAARAAAQQGAQTGTAAQR
jgi:hypothetical protein